MSTEKKWRAVATAAAFGLAIFFTGCGGGDGTPAIVAPASLETRSYDLNPNTGGQTAVSFTSATAYTFKHETGATDQGTYQASRTDNTWTVTLVSETGAKPV